MLSTRNLNFSLLCGALLGALAACGEAPQSIETPAESTAQVPSSPHGMGTVHPASFEGRVVLKGELAAKQEGVLMVSVVPAGGRLPMMSYVIPLDSAPPASADRRVVPFRLDQTNDMMGGGLPAEAMGMELELAVRYDADGKVETKEGDVTVAVPASPNATGLEVVLGE